VRPHTRYRTPLLIIAALLLIFSVLSLSLKRAPVLKKVEGIVVFLTAPGLQALQYMGQTVKRVWLGYF